MSGNAATCNIGIGDAEPPQNGDFESFHGGGLLVGPVIMAGEMEEAVDREMREMMPERRMVGSGLAGERLVGKDDVAKETTGSASPLRRRKGEHIGRLVFAPPSVVEPANGRIMGEHDSKLGIAC